jgi:hypothetical protein
MMGADGINVAKISRQMRQLGLHVHSLSVPALERNRPATPCGVRAAR